MVKTLYYKDFMKKIAYLYLLISLISIKADSKPEPMYNSIYNSLRLGLGKISDIFCGYSNASPEVQEIVEKLKNKMDIKHEIPVKMASLFFKLFGSRYNGGFEGGYETAMCINPGVMDRIYVNEDWFKELSPSAVEFILARISAC